MNLNLEAKSDGEKRVLDYLVNNVTEVLAAKINSGKKTMSGCWEYIKNEARKKAVNGCACIEDAEVFGWAVHFFEEDAISETAPKAAKADTKPKSKKEVKKAAPAMKEKKQEKKLEKKKERKPESEDGKQFSLLDLMEAL